MTRAERRDRGLVTGAGVAAWLLVALPTVLGSWRSPSFTLWSVAWLAFGVAFVVTSARERLDAPMAAGLVVQGAAVVVLVSLLCNGYEGMLLVVVAAQLGRVIPLAPGIFWIVAQTVAVTMGIAFHWSRRPALMLMPPYLGFQLFALFAARVERRLAEGTRLEERLRIAGELHDALGHHLTALSLHLEAAAHRTEGDARESVRVAQSLARSLLGDVRALVHESGEDADPDLHARLTALALRVPAPRVHVDWPQDLHVDARESAHALFRCAQEFVTNSMRHGSASNVWISLRADRESVELAARDDGTGAAEIRAGGGLIGMRRRLEELGGTLALESGPAAGFALVARLPARDPAR